MTTKRVERENTSIEIVPEHPVVRQIELVPLQIPDEAQSDPRAATGVGARRPWWRRNALFIVFFLLPVALAVLYFGVLAANVYVAEAKFIVRSSRSDSSPLAALAQGQGMSRAVDETYAVTEFILSRDAVARLVRDYDLKGILSRPEADMFGRFPNAFFPDNQERLLRAYLGFVDADVDAATGISTLEATAFRPDDAFTLAKALLAIGQDFVNRMNLRANQDAVEFANALVGEAQTRVADVEQKIADYRNHNLVVDPGQESSTSLADLAKMAIELSRLEASLAQQISLAPDSPGIAALRGQVDSYRAEMQKLQSSVVGGADSIASKMQGYEMLMLERDLATKGLASATAELERARHEAQSQRIYLQTVVEPSQPDYPRLPYRALSIAFVTLVSYCVYRIIRGFVDATLEHRA
ncbi:MAG: hypothetical protein P4L82_07135 [Ancalomicrobiaceae bacterium]|nr:hypothetical protein [Ancalomicrobiaceae bacterium]